MTAKLFSRKNMTTNTFVKVFFLVLALFVKGVNDLESSLTFDQVDQLIYYIMAIVLLVLLLIY